MLEMMAKNANAKANLRTILCEPTTLILNPTRACDNNFHFIWIYKSFFSYISFLNENTWVPHMNFQITITCASLYREYYLGNTTYNSKYFLTTHILQTNTEIQPNILFNNDFISSYT